MQAVRSGDVAALVVVLAEHPAPRAGPGAGPRRPDPAARGHRLARAPAERRGHRRRLLVGAGADVDARFAGEHPETPLHWAASSDDVEAVAALLDAGADIDAPGAVIGGGTPLNDATAFGQWDAARRPGRARGRRVRLGRRCAGDDGPRRRAVCTNGAVDSLDGLLWAACHGGHLDTAVLLLDAGADVNWLGWEALTPLGAAERAGAVDVVGWLREQGAVDQPG